MAELSSLVVDPLHERSIFANRTLNMRSIRAVGYDMDYTLIHYDVKQWEQTAYEQLKGRLLELGFPVEDLIYDPEMMIRGLVIDRKLGNIVKPNRFGYVKKAYHGTRPLDFDTQRKTYSRLSVDIREDRWFLLTTLFDLPVACMYAQLVDKLDRKELPRVMGYADLQEQVNNNLDSAYEEGLLKAEVLKDPERYVVEDPETALTLLDQMTWRDLFDLVIVSAGKPNFFLREQPAFEVATEEGLLRPVIGSLKKGGIYVGGHARLVEEAFGMHGGEVIYVGDHVESDVRAVKSIRRWRTALVLRELEEELVCLNEFGARQAELSRLMIKKAKHEMERAQLRLHLQRVKDAYGPESNISASELQRRIEELVDEIRTLDERTRPLAIQAQTLYNRNWGLLTRAGYDKSYLARQLEGYSDIYMSRVSNFLHQTPFAYLRSTRSSLPHDGGIVGGPHDGETGD
jgi:FMN phosphatase YigB (HAD superfamily)